MYIPLDYFLICDRCGGQYRKSEMREEWTGLWVCTRGCWEQRHPQDFVEGVDDDQTVPVARPTVTQTMAESTLQNNMTIWTKRAIVLTWQDLADKDPIGITMNNGATHWSFVDGDPETLSGAPLEDENGDPVLDANGDFIYTTEDFPVGYIVNLNTPVSCAADYENVVYFPGFNNENWQ